MPPDKVTAKAAWRAEGRARNGPRLWASPSLLRRAPRDSTTDWQAPRICLKTCSVWSSGANRSSLASCR